MGELRCLWGPKGLQYSVGRSPIELTCSARHESVGELEASSDGTGMGLGSKR